MDTLVEAPEAQKDDRSLRLAAYKEVKEIIGSVGPAKLSEAESSIISWAAEGLLLATSTEDPEVAESTLAFETLMDDLEQHRWSEMVGTADFPGTATKLRQAMSECSPALVD